MQVNYRIVRILQKYYKVITIHKIRIIKPLNFQQIKVE
jgi:hypothetical protein